MKNINYVIVGVIVVALALLGWFYTGKTGTVPGPSENNNPGEVSLGERTCANLVTAAELNSIFGVNNFSVQTNTGANCIWATGDIKNGITKDVIALSLIMAKVGTSVGQIPAAAEAAFVKEGAKPISGVPHAYILSNNSGVIMFSGEYSYAFGTSDTSHQKELVALAKLLASKN